jgi:hypothetical protein
MLRQQEWLMDRHSDAQRNSATVFEYPKSNKEQRLQSHTPKAAPGVEI